jgi:hypothetical protein
MKAVRVAGGTALVFLALGATPTRAQSEINPDHFDSPNTEPFESVKKSASNETTPLRYQGKFKLPYAVEGDGKQLAPGDYTLSLAASGKRAQITLRRNRYVVSVSGVLQTGIQANRHDALLVKRERGVRTLCLIQIAQREIALRNEWAICSRPNPQSRYDEPFFRQWG